MEFKRKVLIVVAACLTAVLVAAVCLIGVCARQGIGISLGQYVDSAYGDAMLMEGSFLEDNCQVSYETVSGHMMLLDDNYVCMSGREKLFDHLTIGDKLLVIHGPVAETYPGQSKAYMCIRYANGAEEDIPERDWVSLKTEGWLAAGVPISEEEAITIANVYTWYYFDTVKAEQDPANGQWTVELWSPDQPRQETVRISADGQQVEILSGIIYR